MTMSIEEKMVYVRKALELGADIDVCFHQINGKEEAEKVAAELSKMSNRPYQQYSSAGTHWFKIKNYDNRISTAVFYEDYLEEDVDLSGGDEIA